MFALVGETLRRLRKERHMTLGGVAVETDLGRGQLSRIENGHQRATLPTLAKILTALKTGRSEFFRRYDLVEEEALGVERGRAGRDQASGAYAEAARGWPDEIREAVGKLEALVHGSLPASTRAVAQGAFEVGEYVVLFRVLPKGAPELPPELPGARRTSACTHACRPRPRSGPTA